MSKVPYRFGGPIPESVQRLKARRVALAAVAKQMRNKPVGFDALGMPIYPQKSMSGSIDFPEPLAVKHLSLAGGADEAVVDTHDGVPLQNDSATFGKTGLANVVGGILDAWIAGPGLVVAGIAAQRKVTTTNLDQRVFAALIKGCLHLQIFFLHLGKLRLELQKSGVVSEQTLLSLEQLLHEGSGFFVDECGVAHGAHAFGDISSSGD